MAVKKSGTKKMKKLYASVHKFASGLSIICFLVVIAGGVMSEARIMTIVYRSVAVMFAIMLATRLFLRTLESFEETRSGQS